ncbi:VOC family protein [Shewanella maritima]|uniref:VOC family protein n=1 Tax=Shewanella maritima TaxID=2520507 RepID=A0A411PDB8_9GAMM|nr:VOC family protein [Shewanella maritima]QBF81597.1 VOC family protein [Shewanella maritima]
MFDHVVFGVRDFDKSKTFYQKVLAPIGIKTIAEDKLGIELSADGKSSLCIRRTPEDNPAHLHLAFVAQSREQVQSFHQIALQIGAKDNGAPGIRPNYSGQYYAAYVVDPDGHNIEMVYHQE